VDPFASYLSSDQYRQFLKSQESKKASVGLVLSRRFGYVSVVDSIPGTSAGKQGLGTGDVIETINGVSTRDMPLAYAEMLLQGDPGTSVEITALRVRRGADAQKISLVRAGMPDLKVTSKMLPGNIGYVQSNSMTPGKAAEIKDKVTELEKQGATKLVLDLRNNVVGAPEEGYALANLFTGTGLLGSVSGQRVPKQEFRADPAKAAFKLPVVVLTNRGTANGAETAAAALLDNKRAEVVGERSYGEAAIRKAMTLEDGSAVILATAKYYSPSGKSLNDNAVIPSLTVFDAGAGDDDDDETQPAQPEPKPSEDLQLKKAIEVLTDGLEAAKKSMTRQAAPGTNAPEPGRTPLNVPRPPQ
jgi:carboxyl-terminal processing protease